MIIGDINRPSMQVFRLKLKNTRKARLSKTELHITRLNTPQMVEGHPVGEFLGKNFRFFYPKKKEAKKIARALIRNNSSLLTGSRQHFAQGY